MNDDKGGRRGGLDRRANAWISLIVSALIVITLPFRIFGPHDYPAGDPRNEPLFWVVVGVFFLLVVTALVVGAIRTLTRGPKPEDEDD